MKADLLLHVLSQRRKVSELGLSEWELLLAQARQARLNARLAALCETAGLHLDDSPGPFRHMDAALRLADRQQHEVRWEVDCLARALGSLDIGIVLLKGAAYLIAGLPAARGRLFADIDILVARENIPVVEGALMAAGWISDERDAYNQRYYREWMHEIPPLRHVQRNTFIDLHHTITPPTSRFHVEGNLLLANARPVPGESGFLMLAPVDMVLHSAVHLFTEGEFGSGLRDMFDMNDLVHTFQTDPFFWSELFVRAKLLKLQIPLFHALNHLKRLFGTVAPAEFQREIDSMGPNALYRALMTWALSHALRPMHPSCDSRWTGLARWMLYVRSHLLRMPPHLVLPHLLRKTWMRHFPAEGTT